MFLRHIIALILVVSAGAVSAASPCTQLVSTDEENNIIRWSLNQLADIFQANEEAYEETGIGDTDYWFTKSPGRFVGINCGDVPFETQEMYPIGIVVKPISVLDLPSYQRGTPILVLTEYGHRKVVPLEDIAPISENTTYIFPDSYAKSMMCRAKDTCIGNLKETCTKETCKYGISPFFGYASATSADAPVKRAVAAYRKVWQDPLLMPKVDFNDEAFEDYLEELLTIQAQACEPFPVTPWREGGVEHQPRKVWLTFCQNIEKMQNAGFKVVDRDWAKHRFETALWGSFHRNFGDSESLFEDSIRSLLNINIVNKKPCGVEVKTTNSSTMGGGLGAELGIADAIKLELGANRRKVVSFVNTVPDDVYLFYSTYFVRPIQIAGEAPPDKDIWVFDVVFRAECDSGGNPSKASSITIFYDKLSDGYETIDATDQLEHLYFEGNRNDSFAESSIAQIESGRFWFIADHIGYFKWRDTLRSFMINEMPEVQQLLEFYPAEQRPIVRDFFVHLIMSAAFQYKEPPRIPRGL